MIGRVFLGAALFLTMIVVNLLALCLALVSRLILAFCALFDLIKAKSKIQSERDSQYAQRRKTTRRR